MEKEEVRNGSVNREGKEKFKYQKGHLIMEHGCQKGVRKWGQLK
jgi:hypothetical protein